MKAAWVREVRAPEDSGARSSVDTPWLRAERAMIDGTVFEGARLVGARYRAAKRRLACRGGWQRLSTSLPWRDCSREGERAAGFGRSGQKMSKMYRRKI